MEERMEKNRFNKRWIHIIFISLELFLIGSTVFLYNHILSINMEDSLRKFVYFEISQNIILAAVFFAAYLYYQTQIDKNIYSSPYKSLAVVSETGKRKEAVALYNKRSLSVGKTQQNDICIEEKGKASDGASEYAVLNLVSGYWYIEALLPQYPIGIRRGNEGVTYRLKTATPYLISSEDIIYIDTCKILVQ